MKKIRASTLSASGEKRSKKEADEKERLGMIDAKVDNYSADAQARLVAVMEQKQKQIKEHAKATKERDAEIKKAEEEEKKR